MNALDNKAKENMTEEQQETGLIDLSEKND